MRRISARDVFVDLHDAVSLVGVSLGFGFFMAFGEAVGDGWTYWGALCVLAFWLIGGLWR